MYNWVHIQWYNIELLFKSYTKQLLIIILNLRLFHQTLRGWFSKLFLWFKLMKFMCLSYRYATSNFIGFTFVQHARFVIWKSKDELLLSKGNTSPEDLLKHNSGPIEIRKIRNEMFSLCIFLTWYPILCQK